ncbi:hypothetical protein [Hyphococcus sp.]|uniref:hypothetical protein n=1 Tax=Hyphococcus sp. TaxID=2038636 RepID=UPI003CCC22F5
MDLSWEILFPIGTLILFGGLAWGFIQSKRVSKREQEITETATHEMYEHPEDYKHGERQALKEASKREQERQRED